MGYIIPESGDNNVQWNIVPVGTTSKSNNSSFNMRDYGMMPAEPPYISRQQERLSTTTVPGLHGSLIKPSFKDRTNTRQNWETRTGSLDFYYIPDDKNHVLWDEYKESVWERSVDGVAHAHPWCFFGQYHSILHNIQGRRFRTFYMPGDDGGFEGPLTCYQELDLHRAWLSRVKPDSSGRTTVTFSYEAQPSDPYCDFYENM